MASLQIFLISQKKEKEPKGRSPPPTPGLPSNFFDNPSEVPQHLGASKTLEGPKEKEKEQGKEGEKGEDPGNLPKGFFDDKTKDAAARNVEVEDELGAEWEKFQKEIHKETKVSEALKDEDMAVLMLERDQRELMELEHLLKKVQNLERLKAEAERKRQEMLAQEKEKRGQEGEEESDGSEFEDDFLNWRAKKQL